MCVCLYVGLCICLSFIGFQGGNKCRIVNQEDDSFNFHFR